MLVDYAAPVFSTEKALLCHYAEVRQRLNPKKPPPLLKITIPPPVQPAPPQDAVCDAIEWRRVLVAVGAIRAANHAHDQGMSKIETIKRHVARVYGVTRVDIESVRRTAAVVKPRQIAMALCRRLTVDSLPAIGRRFGNRDHTTVLHAIRKLQPLIDAIDQDMPPGADELDWVIAARARTEAAHA